VICDDPTSFDQEVGYMSDTELLHEPSPERISRVEVFTGTGRRRRWTAEQKALIVAESYERGQTASAVARRHGLTPQQLFAWRRDARQQTGNGAAACSMGFASVVVDARAEALISSGLCGGSPVIEIVIGGATIRVPVGTDGATLAAVLRAVRALC
jgi:transposase